jgi:hypothetical protein
MGPSAGQPREVRFRLLNVLEHANGGPVAIEVKAAETVRASDFRGITRR